MDDACGVSRDTHHGSSFGDAKRPAGLLSTKQPEPAPMGITFYPVAGTSWNSRGSLRELYRICLWSLAGYPPPVLVRAREVFRWTTDGDNLLPLGGFLLETSA